LHHAKEGEDQSRFHDSYILARVEEELEKNNISLDRLTDANDRLDISQQELEYIQIPPS